MKYYKNNKVKIQDPESFYHGCYGIVSGLVGEKEYEGFPNL